MCDDEWNIDDGNVVCRQLGFEGVESVRIGAAFGGGSGPIWLDNVRCSGSEDRLSDCSHSGWANHNCGHGEDAGVICVAGKYHKIHYQNRFATKERDLGIVH